MKERSHRGKPGAFYPYVFLELHFKWEIWLIDKYNQTYPQKSWGTVFDFQKRTGETYTLTPTLHLLLHNWVLENVQDDNKKVNLVPKWFIGGFHTKNTKEWKTVKWWGKQKRSYPLVCFLKWKKCWQLKMGLPHCKCFPSTVKLIVVLHYMLLTSEQTLWSYWRTQAFWYFLFIVIPRAWYQKKKWLKHDKNS